MQITQTMQIPLTYAEDIIGVKGANIAYIRANSGAVVTIQESLGSPDDITVEIKGTSSQVQAAQQLIQVMAHHSFIVSSDFHYCKYFDTSSLSRTRCLDTENLSEAVMWAQG